MQLAFLITLGFGKRAGVLLLDIFFIQHVVTELIAHGIDLGQAGAGRGAILIDHVIAATPVGACHAGANAVAVGIVLAGAGHDAAGIEVFAGEKFDVIHKGRVAIARSVLR